jgi:type IV secretion system protein VirD4
MEVGATKHDIDLLFDEFIMFGRIDALKDNLSMLGARDSDRARRAKHSPAARRLAGPDLIIEKCKARLYYAANGETTGREISRQTGTGTATTVQESRRADGWSWVMADARTQQEQQHARKLLTEDEATQISEDTSVLKVTGMFPIWATKARYFQHHTWCHRSTFPRPAMYRRPHGS